MGKTYRHGGGFGPRKKRKGGSAKKSAWVKPPKKSTRSDYNKGDSSTNTRPESRRQK